MCARLAATIEVLNDDVAPDRLSISRQASAAEITISGIHISPARSSDSPAPATITSGTSSWTIATPRFPPAALMPSAAPFERSG